MHYAICIHYTETTTYFVRKVSRKEKLISGNEEIIANQIHDDYYGPRSWDALFGFQNRIDDIGLRNVQPYFGSVARRSMKQVDRLGGGILLRPNDPLGSNNAEVVVNNTPDEAEEPIRIVNTGRNNIVRGMDRVQLRSLDHIGGGNLLKRSLDHIGGGNLLKRSLDSIGGGHLLKRAVDSIGGGYLLK